MPRLLLALLAILPVPAQLVMNTYAGGAIPTGVPANNVFLGNITGIAWDPSGNVVVADGTNNVIRRIGTDGIISTIAGTGATGFAGDGGPALSALINISNPAVCQYDASGNLYFFDSINYRIRRIDPDGIITTVAGDGQYPVAGLDVAGPATARSIGQVFSIAVDPSGNLYFTYNSDNRIFRVNAAGQLQLFLQLPPIDPMEPGSTPVAADSQGNVYFFSETLFPLTLLKATPSGVISTFATFPSSSPSSSALKSDVAGNIYTYVNGQLLRYAADGTSTTIASPPGLTYLTAINTQGDPAFLSIISPNSANHEGLDIIQKFSAQSGLTSIAGANAQPAPDGTPLANAWFLGPITFSFSPSGDLYITEFEACMIRKISAGVLSTFAGTGTCGSGAPSGNAKTSNLGNPVSVAVDSQNNVWVADYSFNLYSIAQNGSVLRTIVSPASGGPIEQLAVDAKDRVYSMNLFSLLRDATDGSVQTLIAPASVGGSLSINGIPITLSGMGTDSAGNVYISSGPANVFVVQDDGTIALSLPFVPGSPSIAFDPSGNLWGSSTTLATANSSGIARVGSNLFGFSGDGGPAQSARMNAVGSVGFGSDGNLYFVDNGHRIRRVTGSGPSAPPVISAGGIVNAISYAGGAVAPGELISIFGSNFAASPLEVNPAINNAIPFTFGRMKVLFNGAPGAIAAITPEQINVFVPFGVTTPVNIQVQVDNVLSAPMTIPVAPTALGFSPSILNQDGTINTSFNPAPRGSVVSFYGTGLGQMTPQLNDGNLAISTPYSTPVNPPTVTIGGQPAQILYAGDAPGFPTGVFQINATIPASIPSGAASVSGQVTVFVK